MTKRLNHTMSRFAFLGCMMVGLALASCAMAETTAATDESKPKEEVKQADFNVVESPIADTCFKKADNERKIDTVVLHYSSAIYWFNPSFQKIVSEEGKEYAKSIGLTPENINEHKYDWKLIKYIFEAYKVSAHYMVPRDGTIVQLVPDNDVAWHAGKSKMPTDGREGANAFSIGIEIMSSHPNDDPSVKTPEDAYTDAQYEAINKIIKHLCAQHKITAVVGHDEIAPDRKTDPGPLFQWDRVRTKDYMPVACQ